MPTNVQARERLKLDSSGSAIIDPHEWNPPALRAATSSLLAALRGSVDVVIPLAATAVFTDREPRLSGNSDYRANLGSGPAHPNVGRDYLHRYVVDARRGAQSSAVSHRRSHCGDSQDAGHHGAGGAEHASASGLVGTEHAGPCGANTSGHCVRLCYRSAPATTTATIASSRAASARYTLGIVRLSA